MAEMSLTERYKEGDPLLDVDREVIDYFDPEYEKKEFPIPSTEAFSGSSGDDQLVYLLVAEYDETHGFEKHGRHTRSNLKVSAVPCTKEEMIKSTANWKKCVNERGSMWSETPDLKAPRTETGSSPKGGEMEPKRSSKFHVSSVALDKQSSRTLHLSSRMRHIVKNQTPRMMRRRFLKSTKN